MADPQLDRIRSTQLRVILPPTHEPMRNMNHNIPTYLDISSTRDSILPPHADFSAPPPYDVAANSKLPTYEEVQREKQMQGDNPTQQQTPPPRHPTFAAFVTVEGSDATAEQLQENSLLGTDIMFVTSFFVAFVFNWIGFLLLMCFSHTVASRYGALAGFGLSLAKWTLIVKHSTELATGEMTFVWWLIMAFGILISCRALIAYLNIKRSWRSLSAPAQERLLFFY